MRAVLGLVAALGLAQTASAQSTASTNSAVKAQADDPELAVVQALKATSAPVVSAQVAPGKALLTAPVAYVYTGVLRSEVKERFGFGIGSTGRAIPAGTPVFGLPLPDPTGVDPHPKLVWCAVVVSGQPVRWNVTCLPKLGASIAFIPIGAAYFPSASLSMGNLATKPDIEEKAVELSPVLTVEVQFAGWNNGQANLRVWMHQQGHMDFGLHPNVNPTTIAGRPHLPVGADGSAHLKVFGGELEIRPAADGKSAIVTQVQTFSASARASAEALVRPARADRPPRT